jgi:gamma-glutamyltranspeptidase / glutathione hydrolase
MNLAFADRDFYYGDPYFPPDEPVRGLLSREYADARRKQIDWTRNDPKLGPGDPYPFQGGTNPFRALLETWGDERPTGPWTQPLGEMRPDSPTATRLANADRMTHDEAFYAGTTSIIAADEEGWLVSVTPSGGWVPSFIAGKTGIGLSQRMQSFVLDPAEGPFNVLAPGKHPRVTLTPTMALKDGKPYLAFAVQGGDSQDQNLLQFFLDVVEFGMNVQEAAEGPNINSYQMRSSFGEHEIEPGRLLLHASTPPWVRAELAKMGYKIETQDRTSGPINAIMIDPKYGTFWGGSSDHGEDYGIGW